MSGMDGQIYAWDDKAWRVLVRWRKPDRPTRVCRFCGHIERSLHDRCGHIGMTKITGTLQNVLIERVAPWQGVGFGDHWFQDKDGRWWRPDGGDIGQGGKTGDRVVRPFRGLRKVSA